MTLYKWSQTAASNGSSDSTCPFPEGMSPAAVNDGTRGMMAAVAKYRDDRAGAIVCGGSVNAYTVASYEGFDTLAHLSGQVIAFTPNFTNTGASTLNTDGLGVKPLRPSPGVDFIGGELILGTPYTALYNNANGEYYVQGFMSSPYAVPVFGGMDFWDTIAPNSCFIFPQGQAISRTTYAAAFARWGTTYGAGNGSTTFNVPDKTGRVSAMIEASASRLTSTYFGGNSTVLGAVGGLQSNSVILTHNHGVTDPGHVHGMPTVVQSGGSGGQPSTGGSFGTVNGTNSATTGISIQNAGSAAAHNIVQPTICCNYIIRIL